MIGPQSVKRFSTNIMLLLFLKQIDYLMVGADRPTIMIFDCTFSVRAKSLCPKVCFLFGGSGKFLHQKEFNFWSL